MKIVAREKFKPLFCNYKDRKTSEISARRIMVKDPGGTKGTTYREFSDV